MTERDDGARPTDPASSSVVGTGRKRKPPPATERAKKAGSENFSKGRKKMAETRAKAKAEGRMKRSERWAMILDGRLKVSDLDDMEIKKCALRSADGTFAGKQPFLPSHIAQQFKAEGIRRAQDKFHTAAPEAVEELLKIGADPDAKPADRIRALTYIVDRALGKTPETVRVEGVDRFSDVVANSVGLNRDIPDDARDLVSETDGEDGSA